MNVFTAVKSGDMARLVYLVEEEQIELQQRDEWDGTPLYYASFTGNQDMVKYLLAKGATCERRVRQYLKSTGAVLQIGYYNVPCRKYLAFPCQSCYAFALLSEDASQAAYQKLEIDRIGTISLVWHVPALI